MSVGKRVLELHDELQSMPEFQLLRRIQTFQHSLDVFEGNYRELRKLLLWQSEHPRAMELWYLRNRHLLQAFQKEVARLLHNFVGAAASLIDHARLHYRELYEDPRQFPEYQEEVSARFATNPLANFIKGLRQYCQHYEVPPLRSEMRTTAEPASWTSRILLDKSKLTEFSGWNAQAREYLEQEGDSIDLLQIIEEYCHLVTEFYRWFSMRQQEIHASDVQRVEAKRREIDAVAVPHQLQTTLALAAKRKWDPDACFDGILTPTQWKQLAHYPTDSPERCEKLIDLVERRASISEDLKSQIRRLYGLEG